MNAARSIRLTTSIGAVLAAALASVVFSTERSDASATLMPVGPPGMHLNNMTTSGRFLLVASNAGRNRLDLETGDLTVLPFGGFLMDDGAAVIGDGRAPRYDITRHDIESGAETTYDVPGEWGGSVTSISGDGRFIGVWAANGVEADVAVFLIDAVGDTIQRPDAPFGGSGTSNGSYDLLVAADGSASAFNFRDGPVGCRWCVDVYVLTATGLTLASPAVGGGTSLTGNNSVQDISGDGRYVLFRSTATDLEGGSGAAEAFYIRDLVTETTAALPVVPATWNNYSKASISDDGRRVVFAVEIDVSTPAGVIRVPIPALYERSSGETKLLVADDDAITSTLRSTVEISGDGRRVAFTTRPIGCCGGDPQTYIADLPPIGPPLPTTTTTSGPTTTSTTVPPATTTSIPTTTSTTTSTSSTTTTTTTTMVPTTTTTSTSSSTTSTTSPPSTFVPGPPRELKAKPARASAEVKLSWRRPQSAGSSAIIDYVIEQSSDGGASWSVVLDDVTTMTSWTVDDLVAGRTYQFRVAARNSAGVGSPSASVIVTTR